MYCLYKNDWVVYQKEHPNWNEEDKRRFQNEVNVPKLKKYHNEAIVKIKKFMTPLVQDKLTELDLKHIHRVEIINKIKELLLESGKKLIVNILVSAAGSFLAVVIALYLRGHWDAFRELIEQVAVK